MVYTIAFSIVYRTNAAIVGGYLLQLQCENYFTHSLMQYVHKLLTRHSQINLKCAIILQCTCRINSITGTLC